MMHAATIHLHRDFLEIIPASYQRCLVAANGMTSIIRELSDGDYDYLDPIISVSVIFPFGISFPELTARFY